MKVSWYTKWKIRRRFARYGIGQQVGMPKADAVSKANFQTLVPINGARVELQVENRILLCGYDLGGELVVEVDNNVAVSYKDIEEFMSLCQSYIVDYRESDLEIDRSGLKE